MLSHGHVYQWILTASVWLATLTAMVVRLRATPRSLRFCSIWVCSESSLSSRPANSDPNEPTKPSVPSRICAACCVCWGEGSKLLRMKIQVTCTYYI